IDLVATDYYNKEIAFQSQIDKERNASQLSSPLEVNYDHGHNAVSIQFPNDFNSKTISGNIHFFRPDDASKDFDVKIGADVSSHQEISTVKMKKGLWRAKIDWSCDGKNFYEEKDFLIN
ncbi:MAG: FixH family protein, partial [Chitinophagales bacterium]